MKNNYFTNKRRLLLKKGFSSNLIFNLVATFILFSSLTTFAQAPSHDPSTMIRNTDGRYWVFTTGDNIWCMSSSNANFTDWRAEVAPFANGYPSWISNYVSGFSGFFWAPDVIKIGSTYYLYYSCAGDGAAAAIGLATASNLAGPWTDQGMIVAGNNAIDPALLYDNGRLWMSWGNWQSGIDICELNASTGKRLNSSSTHLVDGSVEGPGLYKSGSYYFLFYQRGLCCNGVNSTYYMVVARSTSITGPYTNERVFLPNKDGNIIGPGHFGYGEGKLTYHYYDGNDNGNAKLMITTMGISNGWPVAGITTNDGSTIISSVTNGTIDGTYSIIAQHSGKALDVYNWGTSNGTNIAQWDYWGGEAQQFTISQVDNEWHRITPIIATGKALDIVGISTADGANVNLWDYWGGYGQQFRFQNAGSGVYRIINRNSEKCIDVEAASSDNGANVVQWTCISGATNQMFSLINMKSAVGDVIDEVENPELSIFPNPVNSENFIISASLKDDSDVKIEIYNSLGQVVYTRGFMQESAGTFEHKADAMNFTKGIYVVSIQIGQQIMTEKLMIN